MTENSSVLPKTKNPFEKHLYNIIKWCTVLTLFIPLVVTKNLFGGSNFPYTFPKALLFQSLTETMFVCWIILMLTNKSFRPKWKHPIVASATVFVILLSFTQIFSQDTHTSFWAIQNSMNGLFAYWHYHVWFIVLSSTFTNWKTWKVFFTASAIATSIVCINGFIEMSSNNGNRIISSLGNPLFLSSYLFVQFFISLILMAKEQNKTYKLLFALLSFTTLVTLYFTGSRSSLVAIVPTALVGLIVLNKNLSSKIKQLFSSNKKIILTLVAGSLIVLTVSVTWVNSGSGKTWSEENLSPRIHRILTSAWKDRTELWTIALVGSSKHPLVGFGLENFSIPFNQQFDLKKYSSLKEPWYQEAHNQYLDILVATGIIGLIGFLLLFISSFKTLVSENKQTKNVALWLLGLILAGQLIQNIFLFQTFTQNVLLFFVLAAIFFYTQDQEIEWLPKLNIHFKEKESYKYLILPLSLVLIFFIVKINFQAFHQDTINFTANKELSQGHFKQGEDLFKKSLSKKTNYEMDQRLNFADRVITLDVFYGLDTQGMKDVVATTTKELQKEVEERPGRTKSLLAASWLTTINVRNGLDDIKTAEDLTALTINSSPNRQEMYELQSNITLLKNDPESALNFLFVAEDLSHTNLAKGRIAFEKSSVMARVGNYEKTAEYLEDSQKAGYGILSQTTLTNEIARGILINKKLPVELQMYVAEVGNRNSGNQKVVESIAIIFHNLNMTKERDLALSQMQKLSSARAQRIKETLNLK